MQIDLNNDKFKLKSQHLWGVLAVYLLLPPFWMLLVLLLTLYKHDVSQKLISACSICFFASMVLAYLTPVWDTISHYWMWKYITDVDIRPDESEILLGVHW